MCTCDSHLWFISKTLAAHTHANVSDTTGHAQYNHYTRFVPLNESIFIPTYNIGTIILYRYRPSHRDKHMDMHFSFCLPENGVILYNILYTCFVFMHPNVQYNI